ncbi:hypothetical protein BDW42DRAFT_178557 [Aspergillus taichungensis]|uniref:Dyp-type peroxidase n=1 Tax=Aspergillus taichungensis TaxID=482145 RepID=A0A2J5HHN4_9EURO|nr:hypothetical protein BDW42DRAFT_178557 [Aspergillus taichungensis]
MPPPADVLKDMQGDIWPGLGKSYEIFYLFSIAKPDDFKEKIKALADKGEITSAQGALDKRAQNRDSDKPSPSAGINVSFNSEGLKKLKWDDRSLPRGKGLKERYFKEGAKTDTMAQGRDDPDDYDDWMKNHISGKKVINGLFLIAGNKVTCEEGVSFIEKELGDSIERIEAIEGDVGPEHGFEHFGFKDTISQPFLEGWDDASDITLNYQCRPGVIVVNHKGTNGFDEESRLWEPDWAKNGSYFVFRKLEQDVEAFHKHAEKLANDNSLGLNLNAKQLEARFVGRWHSGAPVELHHSEDPGPGYDDNNWDYEEPYHELHCPYGSHIRKCNPRNTFGQTRDKDLSLIMRRGIPYGPRWREEDDEETKKQPRGLLFGCYQSNIQNGYSTIMNRWCNNDGFPLAGSGQDVLVAQPIKGAADPKDQVLHANLYGLDPDGKPHKLRDGKHPEEKKRRCDFPSFVKARGGEYFFTPPISFFTKMVEAL